MLASLIFVCSVTALGTSQAATDDAPYPSKPIRFVVPFAPGGGNDLIARMIGARLTESWGQQVVVDNRAGAGGNIAAEMVARSSPDGYTIFLFNSANAIAPSLYRKIAYNPVKDFDPVILIATSPFILVVHPSSGVQSVKQLIALAKSKPGTLTYASGGNGSSTHLAGEQFKQMAGIDLIHVPYKGAGPALIDLLAGQVNAYFSSIPPALPYIRSGRVRGLGVSSDHRTLLLPDLETISRAGVPGYASGASYGIVAPRGTAPAIVRKINADVAEFLRDHEVQGKFGAQRLEIESGSPAHFGNYMKREIARWAAVIKASGARVD